MQPVHHFFIHCRLIPCKYLRLWDWRNGLHKKPPINSNTMWCYNRCLPSLLSKVFPQYSPPLVDPLESVGLGFYGSTSVFYHQRWSYFFQYCFFVLENSFKCCLFVSIRHTAIFKRCFTFLLTAMSSSYCVFTNPPLRFCGISSHKLSKRSAILLAHRFSFEWGTSTCTWPLLIADILLSAPVLQVGKIFVQTFPYFSLSWFSMTLSSL